MSASTAIGRHQVAAVRAAPESRGVAAGDRADSVDIVIVGGGIHGAGVLQAAAAAGFSALLLEERALAAGTSSRSSKLIPGGLRYLESGRLRLVRESLAERETLLRIAPDLVRLVPVHIPIYRETSRRPWKIRAGLWLYALLGDLARDARFASMPRAEWGALDGLRTDGLQAVFRYHDGQTDDAALVRAVVRSAESLGARTICPARFVNAARRDGGWLVRWLEGGTEKERRCLAIVNAGGPWIEEVRGRISPRPPGLDVELVAGAHIEVEGATARGIYYAEAPRDRRAVLVMPWKAHTLVGTTETPYQGDPATVRPLPQEVDYLRETLAHYFPARAGKVLDAWAGLRVLPKGSGSPFSRSRETTLVCDEERAPRMIAIYGGKLTGYRGTARRVIQRLASALPARTPLADTAQLPLRAERT